MVLDTRADAKSAGGAGPGGNQPEDDFEVAQNVHQMSEADAAIAARQFTMAGVVSTKQRRLEEDLETSSHLAQTASLTSNNNKELLCLEYVANFQRQFEQLFPKRQKLYLFPPNERGMIKFVCTTLRPSLLPYRDLYDAQALARFLAGVIEYEPLADPVTPPRCLPSPAFTLRWRRGDCFDLSVLLTSFLIGAGYDAYVVNGRAPRWICLLDQSRTPLPELPLEEEVRRNRERDDHQARRLHNAAAVAAEADASKGPDIKLESRTAFTSKYVAQCKEKAAQDEQAKGKRLDMYMYDDDVLDDDDPLEGRRVHAWVLVRAGKRGVADHFFIEPTTGRLYSIREAPYLAIESVWNHENYWVNMQLLYQPIATTLFDLSNPTDWEYVFLSATEKKAAQDTVEDSKSIDLGDDLKSLSTNEGDNQGDADSEDELVLDIPPSWVPKLSIDRQTYKRRFVIDAQRVTLYRRSKVEEFAENSHDQGLVLRITAYRDSSCTLPVEIREYFKNRKDKLESRRRYPMEGRFEEYFGPGRQPEALKARLEWIGYRRELHFYTSARMDGLVKREEHIQKRMAEYYEGRDDCLIFRSVTLASDKDEIDSKNPYVLPGGPTGELAIKKMKEKYGRNPSVPADEDARKKAYNVQDGNIRVHFHYATGKITAGSRTYFKAPGTPVEVIMADPGAPKPKLSVLDDELRASIQMEKDCYAAIRHSEMETQDILKIRKREEMAIVLETSFFDANDDDAEAQKKVEINEKGKDAKQEVDYLSPFLQAVHYTGGDLSKDDAHTVREMCLRNLKERLLERANIIQGRLDKENALLAKRQAAFQRSQREHDQGTDEEFERFCSETMFRIQILEQRLASHEETALQKYAEMDQRLHNDPRLRVLYR
ncbi:hypothetical protein ATCC90586_009446 [Pythium insidiosum]|nr:hypothetical protein ATCC90586_009446 [Pythium insidiosum]